MKIIFTICSNNYLAQAKALGDSVRKTNPDYYFFIGLVDTLSPVINYDLEIGHPIVLCEEIGIPDFDSLWKKYDIVELNTCVKPFYLEYFTSTYHDLTHLMYFDPDTFVFGDIKHIENILKDNIEIIFTPHIITPIPLDGKMPNENLFLNYGIYNLGFVGVKNPKNNMSLFRWWGERTFKIGYNRVSEGLFVDQLWMNLIPIFYNNTIVSKHFGLNMAPWNLHERYLSKCNDQKFIVNSTDDLIFYHFSNYKFNKPEILASYYDRFNFENRKDLVEFYNEYRAILIDNNVEKLSVLKCHYVTLKENYHSEIQKAETLKRQKEWEGILKNRSLITKIKDKLKRLLK